MNKEDLILEAGRVLQHFRSMSCTTCVLSIENGVVRSNKLEKLTQIPERCLVISPWLQDNGLTAKHWSRIGSALFEQLSRETR